jgi:hypothetical protein
MDMEHLEESFERMSSFSSPPNSPPMAPPIISMDDGDDDDDDDNTTTYNRPQCTNPMSVTLWQWEPSYSLATFLDSTPRMAMEEGESSFLPSSPAPLVATLLPFCPSSNNATGTTTNTTFIRPTATRAQRFHPGFVGK